MGKRWWEKKNQEGKIYLLVAILLSTLMLVGGVSWIAWAGIQQENGIYGWYAAGGKWIKLTATSTGLFNTNLSGDLTPADGMANPTTAIRSGSYGFLYNGTTWDRLRGDTTNGLDVDVTRVSGTVSVASDLTPGAGMSNPTTAIRTGAYNFGWNGTTWDRLTTTTAGDGIGATGILAIQPYFSIGGTQWNRWTGIALSSNIPSTTAAPYLSAAMRTTGSTSVYPVKDVVEGDDLTTGLPATGLYGFDGTNWDRTKIDANGNLKVSVEEGGFTGSVTPADNLATPTDAINSAVYLMGYDTATWDVIRTASVGSNAPATGLLANVIYGYDPDGNNYDPIEVDTSGSLFVNTGALDHSIDNVAILPDNLIATKNITTATSTVVNGADGDLLSVIVGVGATSGTFILYNDADCASLPAALGTFDASLSGLQYNFNFPFSAGMCIVTNTTANIFVKYRDNP